jgi:hypothetical protein
MRRVCIYHAGCPDGFGAAWAVWRAWGDDAVYVPRGHDDRVRPHDYEDDRVVFVDISPSPDELEELADQAAQVVVLDHHITAQQSLEGDSAFCDRIAGGGHEIHFDLSHSGAVLAWHYFHESGTTPDLLRYVEDQDLWAWKLFGSAEVNAAISSYPLTFDSWNSLASKSAEQLVQEGEPITRANRIEVKRRLKNAAPLAIGNRRVEAVNSTSNRSAIGHELAQRRAFGEPWGCVYRIDGDRVQATLYSIGDFDVASIAVGLGGGGHKNAAGFSTTLNRWLQDFVC